MGMEKEKPYKCDVCQKRYKNLNGLKYHKTHSPPCNPELAAQKAQERQQQLLAAQQNNTTSPSTSSAARGSSMLSNVNGMGMGLNGVSLNTLMQDDTMMS